MTAKTPRTTNSRKRTEDTSLRTNERAANNETASQATIREAEILEPKELDAELLTAELLSDTPLETDIIDAEIIDGEVIVEKTPAKKKKGRAPRAAKVEILDAEEKTGKVVDIDEMDATGEMGEPLEMDDAEVDELDDEDVNGDAFDELMDEDGDTVIDVGDTSLPMPVQRGRFSGDSIQMYLREISRFPMLKPEEEFELAKRVQEFNDSDAAFRLVSSHLRLVVKIAMDFQRRWMQNVLDLIQEGNVGLMRAVNKFDPDKGIRFSYYAAFWIKAYILKFIMDNWRLVKIGTTQAQRKLFYNLNKERQRLITQGYDPDTAMLSERLKVSPEEITEMEQRMDSSDMSLDITVGDESGTSTRMDFLPALGPGIEDTLANNEIANMVQGRIKEIEHLLNDKELEILHKRLLSEDPVTLREIGEQFNITRERVRQIEARLLQKIRDHLFSQIQDFSQDWTHK